MSPRRQRSAGLALLGTFLAGASGVVGAASPEMRKIVTDQASFALYAPDGWQAREGTNGGFRTLVVRDPAGRRAATLSCGGLPAGSDLEAFARSRVAAFARQRSGLVLRKAFVSPDRLRLAFEGAWGPRAARREFRSWLSGRDGTFVYSSIEAPEGDLARERPLLLTILANVRIVKGSFASRGGPAPLFPYRLRDGSASFRIPSGWKVTELGRGQFLAVDGAGTTSFVVSAAEVLTPKLGVRPPDIPVSPFLPPHEALAFLASRAGLGSDWRFESVVSRDDLARDVARVYTAGPVQAEEFVHTSVSRGQPMKGYTLGFSLGSRLGTNWIFRHLSVSAPRARFGSMVPTFVAMLQSYAIDDAWAKRYVAAGLERLRRLQQETSALVARNADEIHSMMQAAYDERQRSQEWIDYQRTSYIRGTQDWISSVEGGAVYHSDSWGTKNTATGEFWEGKPHDYVNFKGENPKYDEQMTPIDNRRLYEASKGK